MEEQIQAVSRLNDLASSSGSLDGFAGPAEGTIPQVGIPDFSFGSIVLGRRS